MALHSAASRRLRLSYVDVFIIVEGLREGRFKPNLIPGIRQKAERLLNQERQELLAAGVPDIWLESLQMPFVALLDEAARHSSNQEIAAQWESLQYPLYRAENLGSRVFDELARVRSDPAVPVEVLEVYLRCFAAGFKGQYAPDRMHELGQLRDGLRHLVHQRMGEPPPLSTGFLETIQVEAGAPMLRPYWPWATAGAICLMVTLFTGFLGFREADRAVEQLKRLEDHTQHNEPSKPVGDVQ